MTQHEQNIAARLARMETKQEHIARVVDRIETRERDIHTRLVTLEGQERRMAGLPDRVAHNEAANDVQEAVKSAVKAERDAMKEDRVQFVRHIYGAIGAAGVLFAFVSYFIGGNGP